jgi:hypothetical protein
MKDLETLSREETRESVEPAFSSVTPEPAQTVQQSEPTSRFADYDSLVGRERYRLSPLSEW